MLRNKVVLFGAVMACLMIIRIVRFKVGPCSPELETIINSHV